MRILCVLTVVVGVIVMISGGIVLVAQPFSGEFASRPPPVSVNQLQLHVRHLSETLYPRSYDQFRNIDRAAQYIHNKFKASGGVVSVQEVSVEDATYQNIVVRFGPASGAVMVIGAHYDTHGNASEGAKTSRGYTPDSHTPGADDNASGVAALLELARLLGRTPQARPIELVAYTLEEPPYFRTGHMGSAWHAKALRAAGHDVSFMLSLEMIGYFSDVPGSQRYPVAAMGYIYPDRGDFIALVGKMSDFSAIRRIKAIMGGASNLPVYSINAPPLLQGIDFSDHLSYWRAGYPAFMITDTGFLRNPNYHRAGDTFEKLDFGRMANVVQAVYAVTQHY